jgi:O-antigen/teichoic acid export membrane protein
MIPTSGVHEEVVASSAPGSGPEISTVLLELGKPVRSDARAFAQHVVLFSLANLVALVCNGVLTFLLPRMLSMESYGYYRLFLLYGGFAGLLHLGLLDGGLIRWAARPQQRIKPELLHALVFLLVEHLVLLLPALLILLAFFPQQTWFWLLPATALYALVFNSSTLGQFALQAGKLFGVLSAITLINPAVLLTEVILLNRWKHLTLLSLVAAYIFSWLVAGVVAWVVLAKRFPRGAGGRTACPRRVWRIGAYNIRMGWSVLVANTFTAVIFSLDRIAVSVAFPIRDFAIYALAANALAVVTTTILSIARVVFPYLSDGLSPETRARAYLRGEACLVGLWAISLAGYFLLRWLISWLLPNYVSSLPVLRLLMLTTGLTAIIHILQSNYFRSTHRQKQLLLGCAAGLVSASVLMWLARRTGHLATMALAMLGALVVWWLANELLLRPITGRNMLNVARTILVFAGCGLWFVVCSSQANLIQWALAYAVGAGIVVGIAYRPILRLTPRLKLSPFLGLES